MAKGAILEREAREAALRQQQGQQGSLQQQQLWDDASDGLDGATGEGENEAADGSHEDAAGEEDDAERDDGGRTVEDEDEDANSLGDGADAPSTASEAAPMAEESAAAPSPAPSPAADEAGDRLSAIAAAGGIIPLVALVTTGAPLSKERAASALWHLSVDAVNQIAIAKASGIAPLVQLLDDGTEQATVYAAEALDRLARDNADIQAQIAKKLVSLLSSRNEGAQQRSAHALWELALRHPGAPVRIVNAGAISPLVALLGNGSIAAKEEAVGALSQLAHNDPSNQLAIATGLVALLGSGSAEGQEHVTQVIHQPSCLGPSPLCHSGPLLWMAIGVQTSPMRPL